MRKTVTSVDPTPLISNGVNLLFKHVKLTLCKMIYKSLADKKHFKQSWGFSFPLMLVNNYSVRNSKQK